MRSRAGCRASTCRSPVSSRSCAGCHARSQTGLHVVANAYSLDNKPLLHHEETKDTRADAVTDGFKLDLAPLLTDSVILVKLELRTGTGQLISDNFYWLGAESSSYRRLNKLQPATLSAAATSTRSGDMTTIHVTLENRGSVVALASKLTLVAAPDGARILPAYLSDNYVSLLPAEQRAIDIEYPSAAASGAPQLNVRGWNVAPMTIPVTQTK